jgi:hypothetical protein
MREQPFILGQEVGATPELIPIRRFYDGVRCRGDPPGSKKARSYALLATPNL